MAIVQNHRLEYEMSSIKVNYPDVGEVTYNGSSPLIVPNNWTPTPEALAKKGDLIIMDGKQYRVLKMNGTVAEVLCMYNAGSIIFDSATSGDNHIYAGKDVDAYCNKNFYSSLPITMQRAIVDKIFTQDSWIYAAQSPAQPHYTGKYDGSSMYYMILANASYDTSITRHCYCLSVQDVLDYLECTMSMDASNTTLTEINIWQMFWNRSMSQKDPTDLIWLRSASKEAVLFRIFLVSEYFGRISTGGTKSTANVHPAFQIDLSKVEFTKE